MSNLFFDQDFLFDSHCHLSERDFDPDRAQVVTRAKAAGVQAMVAAGVDVDSSAAAVKYAGEYPGAVFAAAGIAPDMLIPGSDLYAPEFDAVAALESIRSLLADDQQQLATTGRRRIVAIGEAGIDHYWIARGLADGSVTEAAASQSRARQQDLFIQQLELARAYRLPLTVHSRGAEQLCLDLVKDFPDVHGVFHSFTGTYELARQMLDCGWGLGVNGIITYPNAGSLRALYRQILGQVAPSWTPADFYGRGVYFETDAPFLSPQARRGQRNEPACVAEVVKFLCQ